MVNNFLAIEVYFYETIKIYNFMNVDELNSSIVEFFCIKDDEYQFTLMLLVKLRFLMYVILKKKLIQLLEKYELYLNNNKLI